MPPHAGFDAGCVCAGFNFLENKFFTAGAFGGTLPAIYMADEGDGQKPVTDMRIFCGEVKSRDALAWKVATAGSAMLSTSLQSGGLVQVWNPVSQVTKRVERFRADYFAGKTSELCYECGDRPAKSTLYSYVSVKHPFIGPVGKPGQGPTTQFVPGHLLIHHLLSNEYRECDFLADFILRSAEHNDGSHDLLELRVDTPVGVDNLIMKADQPVPNASNAQAEIPQKVARPHHLTPLTQLTAVSRHAPKRAAARSSALHPLAQHTCAWLQVRTGTNICQLQTRQQRTFHCRDPAPRLRRNAANPRPSSGACDHTRRALPPSRSRRTTARPARCPRRSACTRSCHDRGAGTEQPTCSARTEQPSCSLRSRPAKFTSEHSNGQPRHNPQHTLHLSHTKRCVAAYA